MTDHRSSFQLVSELQLRGRHELASGPKKQSANDSRRESSRDAQDAHESSSSLPAFQERQDPHVARALAAMKADPKQRWTVARLARVGGLSRAAFARRFTRAIGTSPLRWLTQHRLELAQRRLLETDHALASIAAEIGYESEFAFAKAFKRLIGIAPGVFRRVELVRRHTWTAPPSSTAFRAAA